MFVSRVPRLSLPAVLICALAVPAASATASDDRDGHRYAYRVEDASRHDGKWSGHDSTWWGRHGFKWWDRGNDKGRRHHGRHHNGWGGYEYKRSRHDNPSYNGPRTVKAPEIDAAAGVQALALLSGVLLLAGDRARRRARAAGGSQH